MVCADESVKAKSVGCYGMALTMAFTFYMVVFHSLSNLPLDQPLYFEVCPVSSSSCVRALRAASLQRMISVVCTIVSSTSLSPCVCVSMSVCLV